MKHQMPFDQVAIFSYNLGVGTTSIVNLKCIEIVLFSVNGSQYILGHFIDISHVRAKCLQN